MRVIEEGHRFDSYLERDWAGFIAHIGLRWRREPFAVRSDEQGPTTMMNVIARPDFFLPDIAAIFECKPTMEQEAACRSKWQRIADRTGLPVVTTTGRPIIAESVPLLGLYREDECPAPAVFARCPDCTAVGLLALRTMDRQSDGRPVRELVARFRQDDVASLWLSPCRHRPRWDLREFGFAAAGAPYPRRPVA